MRVLEVPLAVPAPNVGVCVDFPLRLPPGRFNRTPPVDSHAKLGGIAAPGKAIAGSSPLKPPLESGSRNLWVLPLEIQEQPNRC